MSTRATITVSDKSESFDIYRHHDGYPQSPHGVVQDIKAAMTNAWPSGFEASDVGAAIVARMKTGPGSVHLTKEARLHSDRAYHYEVSKPGNDVMLTVERFSYRVDKLLPEFAGTLDEAVTHYDAEPTLHIELPVQSAELITESLKLAARLLAERSESTAHQHGIRQIKMALAVLPTACARTVEVSSDKVSR